MRLEQQPTYVLHARAYRETSLLLECLTRDLGRIGVVARGVRSERGRLLRAQLEPFQPLTLNLLLRGELATLQAADSSGSPLRLQGDAGLAGLYLNELVVRLTERQDHHPLLFETYAETLQRLHSGSQLGWHLRRFERDLLDTLGYAMQLLDDADSGEPILANAHYHYQPEHGPIRCGAGETRSIRGADLLAFSADQSPDVQGLQSLRRLMRDVIRFHLGGAELRAWRVLSSALTRR